MKTISFRVEGGTLWFTDLSVADSTMMLPILNALSFVLMIELGSADNGAPPEKVIMMKNVFRGLAVIMIPATMNFSQGLFVYWSVNNTFSLVQGVLLRDERVRRFFDIPKVPLPVNNVKSNVSSSQVESPFAAFTKAVQQHRKDVEQEAKIEVVDGITRVTRLSMPDEPTPPPPGSKSMRTNLETDWEKCKTQNDLRTEKQTDSKRNSDDRRKE